MASGGRRVGAGRKFTEYGEFQESIGRGIYRGLARAGRLRGLEGPDIVEQVVERIVSDEVIRGRGWDCLRALPTIVPNLQAAGDDKASSGGGSALIAALQKLPGMPSGGTATALDAAEDMPEPSNTGPDEPGARIPQFVAPQSRGLSPLFFEPQESLELDVIEGEATPAEPAAEAAPGRPAPHPPRAVAPGDIHPHGEIFEFSGPDAASD